MRVSQAYQPNQQPLYGRPFALIAIAGFLLTVMLHAGAVAQTKSSQGIRNIVIVHGAWADGSSWSKVIPLLQAKGLHVVAVQNPLTSLADDVAATKRAIALQDGPVMLVGHSYGGAVITEGRKRSKGSRVGLCGCARAAGWRVLRFGSQVLSASPAS
jgi:pimeloyl-ACP methyl ester carboxylesterase